MQGLSRRDFLKLSCAGFGALLIPAAAAGSPVLPGGQSIELPCAGRSFSDHVTLHAEPDSRSKLVDRLKKDQVVAIERDTLCEDGPAHNRYWYRLAGGVYAHSSGLQAVKSTTNPVVEVIPAGGIPAEVTVPFTDSWWEITQVNLAFRLYYGSISWVTRVVKDRSGRVWYCLVDEGKEPIYYFAPAECLRILTAEDVAPLAPHVPADRKHIDVNLPAQTLIAYEEKQPVMVTRISSGGRFPLLDLSTPRGKYYTNYKMPSRHMVHADQLEENAYDLPGVPWVCFLTTNGVAFHGTYWHNDFGRPRSHGCINMNLQAARWLYRWSIPAVPLNEKTYLTRTGTTVEII